MSLQFTVFDIHTSSSGYCHDHLSITDGDGTALINKLCGSLQFAAITSNTNMIEIYFSSDQSGAASGFSLTWSAVEPTAATTGASQL